MRANSESWRPNHATVVAYLALFVALSGSAWAAAKIGPHDISRNAVRGKHIKDDTVTGTDVAEASLGTVPSAHNADQLDNLDSSDFLRSNATAANAEQLDGLNSTDFALTTHDHDAAYVNEGQPDSVNAAMVADVSRSVSIPLASFVDCQTDSGAPLGFVSDVDPIADFNNSAADGQGFTIRFDATGGSPDEDSEICSQLMVPADFAPGQFGVLRFRVSKPTETATNTERIEIAVATNGGGAGGTNNAVVSGIGNQSIPITELILAGANQSLSFYVRVGSPGTMDDAVDIHAVSFEYISIQ